MGDGIERYELPDYGLLRRPCAGIRPLVRTMMGARGTRAVSSFGDASEVAEYERLVAAATEAVGCGDLPRAKTWAQALPRRVFATMDRPPEIPGEHVAWLSEHGDPLSPCTCPDCAASRAWRREHSDPDHPNVFVDHRVEEVEPATSPVAFVAWWFEQGLPEPEGFPADLRPNGAAGGEVGRRVMTADQAQKADTKAIMLQLKREQPDLNQAQLARQPRVKAFIGRAVSERTLRRWAAELDLRDKAERVGRPRGSG